MPGTKGAHGIAVDPFTRTAFVAGEENATVCAFNLSQNTVGAVATVGTDVDVVDVDPAVRRPASPVVSADVTGR